MATKLYDVAVKTGTYTNNSGEEKGRYENVGSVWDGDNGMYLVMKRTFNPAGVPFKDGSDSIFLSLFEPKDNQQQQRQQPSNQRQSGRDYSAAKNGSKAPPNFDDMDDSDIPFR